MIMGGMGLLERMKFSKKKYLGKMMVVKITRRRDLKKIRKKGMFDQTWEGISSKVKSPR